MIYAGSVCKYIINTTIMMYCSACVVANDKRLIYGVNIMGLCVNNVDDIL